MGEVHLARTPWPDSSLVAIKLLRQELTANPVYVDRFAHELGLAVKLEHSNIVAAVAQGEVEGRAYLASQYVPGQDLASVLRVTKEQGAEIPKAIGLRIFKDTLAGLNHIHELKDGDGQWLELVHRDIAPGNILLGYDGVARVSDFGIASSTILSEEKAPEWAVGRTEYTAPELQTTNRPSAAADVYSTGMMARKLFPEWPEWMDVLVERMLDTNPMNRPTCQEGMACLNTHLREAGELATPVSCARWLEATFATARASAMSEIEKLQSLDPEAVQDRVKYTLTFTEYVSSHN